MRREKVEKEKKEKEEEKKNKVLMTKLIQLIFMKVMIKRTLKIINMTCLSHVVSN